MIKVKYKDNSFKEYKTLTEMKKAEGLKITNEVLSRSIRDKFYHGILIEVLDDTEILKIIWTNRYNETFVYDIRYKFDPYYWDIIDFTK